MKSIESSLRKKNYYQLVRSNDHLKSELTYDIELIQLYSEGILQIIDHLYITITAGGLGNFAVPTIKELNDGLADHLKTIDGLQELHSITTLLDALNKALHKFSARLFNSDGNNSERYGYEHYLQDFLEKQLAEFILKDERFRPWDIVSKLLERTELLGNFYAPFSESFPRSWIDADITSWRNKENVSILRQLSVMERPQFQNLDSEWLNEPDKSTYESIKTALRSADYAMLKISLAFKTKVLLKKSPADWLIFWDRLEIPMLQLLALRHAPAPEALQNMASELSAYKGELRCSKTQLAIILLIKFKDVCTEIGRLLDFYRHPENWPQNPSEEYNERLLSEGSKLADDWFKGLTDRFKAFFEVVSQLMPQQELANWLLDRRTLGGSPLYQELASEELGKIWHAIRASLPTELKLLIELLRSKLNIRQFGFIFDQLETQLVVTNAEEMLKLLSELVAQKGFFWDGSFTTEYWSAIKAAGKLLGKSSEPVALAKSLLGEFTVYYEGWKLSSEHDNIIRESFILSCVILLMEQEGVFNEQADLDKFFQDIADYIIMQTRFAGDSEKNYNPPLLLMTIVAGNLESNAKSDFEVRLVDELDDFQSLVRILTAANNPLDPVSKSRFSKRVEVELPFIRKKLEQRDQRQAIIDLEASVGALQ